MQSGENCERALPTVFHLQWVIQMIAADFPEDQAVCSNDRSRALFAMFYPALYIFLLYWRFKSNHAKKYFSQFRRTSGGVIILNLPNLHCVECTFLSLCVHGVLHWSLPHDLSLWLCQEQG